MPFCVKGLIGKAASCLSPKSSEIRMELGVERNQGFRIPQILRESRISSWSIGKSKDGDACREKGVSLSQGKEPRDIM